MKASVKEIAPVSVIMPVFNGEKYIQEAFKSIADQTLMPAEILVIDDGSIDKTCQKVLTISQQMTLPVKLISHPTNKGFPFALNTGVVNVSSPFCMFLDADDLYEIEAIEALYTCIKTYSVDIVMGIVDQFVCASSYKKFDLRNNHILGGTLGTMIIASDCFKKIGIFDDGFSFGPNIEWISRAQAYGLKIMELNKLILNRRLHDTNMSHNKDNRLFFLEIAKRNIMRKKENV